MYASARCCAELRAELGLEADVGVSGYFLAACDEAASAHPHRRGPRKLARMASYQGRAMTSNSWSDRGQTSSQ